MFTATLVKIDSNHNNLRSDEIKGWFFELPVEGQEFRFFGEPFDKNLDPEYYSRIITTTPAVSVHMANAHNTLFKTANSIYSLLDITEVTES